MCFGRASITILALKRCQLQGGFTPWPHQGALGSAPCIFQRRAAPRPPEVDLPSLTIYPGTTPVNNCNIPTLLNLQVSGRRIRSKLYSPYSEVLLYLLDLLLWGILQRISGFEKIQLFIHILVQSTSKEIQDLKFIVTKQIVIPRGYVYTSPKLSVRSTTPKDIQSQQLHFIKLKFSSIYSSRSRSPKAYIHSPYRHYPSYLGDSIVADVTLFGLWEAVIQS